ncbi:MAG: RNA-binding protein [Tunicatimonas sp.]
MNIYVANLNFKVQDEELRELFEAYGEVSSAKIIQDRDSGQSRGFGFVEMPSDEDASAAIENLDGTDFGGRDLRVSEARPKPSGGGGGGGYRR